MSLFAVPAEDAGGRRISLLPGEVLGRFRTPPASRGRQTRVGRLTFGPVRDRRCFRFAWGVDDRRDRADATPKRVEDGSASSRSLSARPSAPPAAPSPRRSRNSGSGARRLDKGCR